MKEGSKEKKQDYLTPLDFIQLVRTDPEMRDEFCYMLKRTNAYDWEIVDFNDKEKGVKEKKGRLGGANEYMTISSRGIVHTIDSEETFITLDEWEREYKIYSKLKRIKFFEHYRLWKNFMLWRKLRRRTNFKKKRAFLENNLFLVDNKLSFPLLEIRDICVDISGRNGLINMSLNGPISLPAYEEYINNSQLKNTEALNQTVNGQIKAKLADSCRVSLNHFKELNRIKNREADQGKTDEKPLAINNEPGKEMPYTQEATIRIHKKKLKKFIRLIDYLVIDAKLGMVNNSLAKTDDFLKKSHVAVATNLKNNGGIYPTFVIKPEFQNGKMIFIPSIERLTKSVDEAIIKGLHYICDQSSMLVNSNEFETYTKIEEKTKDIGSEGIDLYKLISTNDNFVYLKDHISIELAQIFNFVQTKAEDLLPILKIVIKCEAFSPEKLENKERGHILEMIEEFFEDDISISRIAEKYDIGVFSFEREDLKKLILDYANNCLDTIETHLPQIIIRRSTEYIEKMKSLYERLSQPIPDVESFINHIAVLEACSLEFDELNGEYSLLQDLSLLFTNQTRPLMFPEDCKSALSNLKYHKDLVKKLIDELGDKIDPETVRFKKELTLMIPQLEEQRREVEAVLKELEPDDPDKNPDELAAQLEPLKAKAEELVLIGEKYQNFQGKLNMDFSSIDDLMETKKKVNAYHSFWSIKADWNSLMKKWKDVPLKEVDIELFRNKLETYLKKVNGLNKEIEGNDTFRAFKEELEKTKGVLLVVESFAVKALEVADWEEIKGILKADKEIFYEEFDYSSEDFKLTQVIDMNMASHKNEISEISIRSAKIKELEERLQRIQAFWTDSASHMKTEDYKAFGEVRVLGNNDEMIKRLETALVDLTNILSNKYVMKIKERVVKEQQKFLRLQNFLDEAYFCQRMWLYLEPIYNSEESSKELKKESASFKKDVHKVMIKMIKDISDNERNFVSSKFGRYEPTHEDKRLMELEKIHEKLEELEKQLINYLESKRKSFPRFYFISNDDLIEILSQSKDVAKFQSHVNKLFECIKKFGEENSVCFISMISPEGEEVAFETSQSFPSPSEQINKTLQNLENAMIDSIKRDVKGVWKQMTEANTPRMDCIMGKYCAQAILLADAIAWTKSAESCLESEDPYDELDKQVDTMIGELKEVLEKVRSDLKPVKRKLINSLITQDVHFRDILSSLRDDEVESRDDFKWQQQLRFYNTQGVTKDSELVYCRQVNAELLYCNEFLGVPSKLAITPLTDRCWMTITTALCLNLGCAPVGPAGTGKTESTKDLAKNLATMCIVYNCSEQVTVSMMSTQFMGVMHTGAWLCLDEFNRIDIEVLSVIAQQVLSMKNALSLIKDPVQNPTFNFDGQTLGSADVSNFKGLTVFTTMNPGYAGRTELPDNLKVLFRSVSMMVPDYALIAEILLFSEGFYLAKELAVKLTRLYKLADEQLSRQQHYDFGMRAVKSILSMAGNLKRANPDSDEDMLLIQAMKDTNIPKFLDVDIKLFEAIVQDLFPGRKNEKVPEPRFLEELKKTIDSLKLQGTEKFIEKCMQFDEIMKIRFGNMLLGPPMTGKSKVLECLRQTYTLLSRERVVKGYYPVDMIVINPKSIAMGELYGETNPKTGDYTNGLASKIFTDFAVREKQELKWIVFDGPVDSLWIENLNSVLDDSMTLCLSNGKRIKLRLDMRVLFEVQDLLQASPATVSRIGMVYLDSDVVSPMMLLKNMLEKEFENIELPEVHKAFYISRCDEHFEKLMPFIRKQGKEPLRTINNNLAHSFVKIVKTFYELDDWKTRFISEDPEEAKKIEETMIGRIFLFATAWSVMATMDEISTMKMDHFANSLFNMNDMPRGSLFDYWLDLKERENHWVKWDSMVKEFEYNPTTPWSEMLVPTVNTIRFSRLLSRAVSTKYPVYLSGITGTGKTVVCQNTVKEMTLQGLISPLPFTFSAKTSSMQVQAQITSKTNSLRKDITTIYGTEKVTCLIPKLSPKTLVIHIDDINMPEVEQYGAQPPIELLRQLIDQGGFYDRTLHQWRHVEDTVILATSVPPGNGRLPLTDRFMRHFHILNIHASSDEIMKGIFGQVLKQFFQAANPPFKPKILLMDQPLVQGTLNLYRDMVSKMLPTPTKSHYTFNLRDVSKVFQGLLRMKPAKFQEPETVAKLWIHECTRVFCDRLATQKDREYFAAQLSALSSGACGMNVPADDILTDRYKFGDFLNSTTRELELLDKPDRLVKAIDLYMNETSIKIELFDDSIRHLCRLCRILRQVGGNGLLIGVGGSGKKSLVTVAAEMAGTILRQIEPTRNYGIHEFRKEVFEKMLIPSGAHGKEVTFLLTDTHVVHESFLEDVNSLINTGEILLDREMTDKLKKEAEAEMAKLRINEDPIEFFTKRVKDKLHVMLAMSPVGDSLRTRVRNFPSFVNCCTIDWLDPWPIEALQTVASKMLEETFKEQNVDSETSKAITLACVDSHILSIRAAEEFLSLLKRRVYITPKTYIDLIKKFKDMLKELKGNVDTNISKLSNGLSKLVESGEKVEFYKEEISRMTPILEEKNINIQEFIEKLAKEKQVVEKEAVIVEKEKAIVESKADQINDIKKDAEIEFTKAKIILDNAMKALDVLTRGEIAQMKTSKLDFPVKDLLEMTQILLKRGVDEKSIRSTLSDASIINVLKRVVPRDITKEMVINIQNRFKANPNLNEDKIGQVNSAMVSIYKWIKGLIEAQASDEIVRKTEEKVDELTRTYNQSLKELQKKQDQFDLLVSKLTSLENDYKVSKAEQESLAAQLAGNKMKLENSGKLTQGLADEHVRWVESIKNLTFSKAYIIGDAFLSSACIAYHGPFTGIYRQNLLDKWCQAMQNLKIKFSPNFEFENTVGDISLIRKWNVFGLPSNKISVCNGILVTRSTSYPYLIDPQLQASKWIKKMETDGETKLQIVKANDTKNLTKVVEAAIANNNPVLIEDADEKINPFLDPLLLKQFTIKGSKQILKLGTEELVVEPDFRLYFATKISNPNFLPELFIRVSIINFTVTEDGLEEQLLAEVVKEVMPDIEEKRVSLIVSIAEGKNELRRNEDLILMELKNSQGNILENTPLIENLENSKRKSDEVKATLEANEDTQKTITAARDQLKDVAVRGSLLYFIICDLADIDPMYQFSLSYVTRLFVNTIRTSPKAYSMKEQCETFVEKITENIYLNVCRGLFNEHKKIFAFLVASKIQKKLGLIKSAEWDLFLKGIPMGAQFKVSKMPPSVQLADTAWERMFYLASFCEPVRDLLDGMQKDNGLLNQVVEQWSKSPDPLHVQLPRDYDPKLTIFQKMLLVQCLRPESVLVSMISYVRIFNIRLKRFWERSLWPTRLRSSAKCSKIATIRLRWSSFYPLVLILFSPFKDLQVRLVRT